MRNYRLIRSARRTLSLEITRDGEVLVRAPQRVPRAQIDAFVAGHDDWLTKKLAEAARRRATTPEPTQEEVEALVQAAKTYLPGRVAYWSGVTGLTPTGVKITRARTRYGSCSPKDSLCFSCYLMRHAAPEIDYVIVHELAHIREKNHGPRFYALIAQFLPDYKARVKRLKSI